VGQIKDTQAVNEQIISSLLEENIDDNILEKEQERSQKRTNQIFSYSGSSKRKFVVESSNWGASLGERRSAGHELGAQRGPRTDQLREAAGKYWGYDKEATETGGSQSVVFISKGQQSNANAQVPFSMWVSEPIYTYNPESFAGERNPFFEVVQVVRLRPNKRMFSKLSKVPGSTEQLYRSDNWHSVIEGFVDGEPAGHSGIINESVVYTKNDSIDNTRLAFLTPANVSLGTDGNISLLDNPFDAKTNLKIQTTISNINLAKKSPFQAFKPLTVENPQKPLKFDPQDLNIKNELTNIMANFNCTLITSISNPFHGMLQLLIMDYDPYTDVGDLLGDEWMGIDELDVPAIQKASEDHEVTTNKNPIPIFANLAFPLFTSGAGMTNIFSKFSILKAPTGTTKSWLKSTYNMDYYTLNSSNNAVTNYNKFSAAE